MACTIESEEIEGLGDEDDSCLHGYILTREAVGVSQAVEAVVAVALSLNGVRLARGVPFGMACCSVQPGSHLLEGGLHEALI